MHPSVIKINFSRNVLLAILLILLFPPVFCQDELPKKVAKILQSADEHYNQSEFDKAAELYLDVFERMPGRYSAEQLAYCYTLLNEPQTAVFWFEKAEQHSDGFSPDFIIRFALALMETGEYDYAREKFQEYNGFLESDNPLVYKYLASIEHRGKYFEDSVYFKLSSINLNTPYAEFLPYYEKGILMYLKAGQTADLAPFANSAVLEVAKEKYLADFENITKVSGDKMLNGNILSFSKSTTTDQLVFTYAQSNADGLKKYVLYEGILNANYQLEDITPLLVDGFAMNTLHASLSPSGQRLVFTSDAPGGYGGFDLYVANWRNGQFQDVRNMGPSVNSSEDEYYPYLQNDSILFFSSIGHGGLGGYDLFRTNINQERPAIQNLGYPVNSKVDDYSICFVDGLNGYTSSARAGDDNIYRLQIKAIRFSSTIIDEDDHHNIKNVDIAMIPENGETQNLALADNGKLELLIKPGTSFRIEVQKEGYEKRETFYDSKNWQLDGLHNFKAAPIQIEKVETAGDPAILSSTEIESAPGTAAVEIVREEPPSAEIEPISVPVDDPGIVFRLQIAASRSPLAESSLRKKYQGNASVYMFQEEGWYKYAIGDFVSYYEAKKYRKNCGVPDAFIAAYKGKKKLVLSEAIHEVYQFEKQASEKAAQASISGAPSILRREYFYAIDKAELPAGDLKKLDPFIDSLKANPSYYLEVTGYTDILGGSIYNKALSMERAQNIRQHFVRNGIESKRIGIFGFGSSNSTTISSDDRKVVVELKRRK